MRTTQRLSVIAILLMGSSIAVTAGTRTGHPVSAAATRPYTLPADSSLYQLALQSGITVAELRAMNRGSLDRRDTLKAGDSLALPANSPLLPVADSTGLYINNLPEMGMGNTPLPKMNKDGKPDASAGERAIAGAAQSLGGQDWNNMTGDQAKDQAGNWAKNQAKSRVLSPVQQQAQDLLGKFGKAQVSLSIDDNGDLSKSAFSLFTPWYENDSLVTFSQVGVHDQDGRTIGNFGAGVRWDQQDFLLGYNTFIDRDFTRHHSRLGQGIELWADYTKLAANYYHPLTSWKDSRDFDDYLERPAKGFDVRLQGYLPAYPHLGASVVYEQYFGDEVALFGKDNLQSDPRAVTLGLDYTPIPLTTLKVSHKEGQQGQKNAQVDLQLNYQIGTSLEKQLDPENVNAMRTLRGSRYDLVDRNYDIVLEYKEKAGLLEVDLAAVPATLLEGDTHLMQPLVKNKYRITDVSWNGDVTPLSVLATAGTDNPQGWQITLPTWDPVIAANNTYHLAVTLQDERGRKVTSNSVDIVVGQQRKGGLIFIGTPTAAATGQNSDAVHLVAHITDHKNVPVADDSLKPVWQVTNAAGQVITLVTEAECPRDINNALLACVRIKSQEVIRVEGVDQHHLELVSSVPGVYQVTADLGRYGTTGSSSIDFVSAGGSGAVSRVEILDPAGLDMLAGSGHLNVGVTYQVKFYDAGNVDITASLPAAGVHWLLHGTNTSAGCNDSLTNHDTGVTGYSFTPRVNTASNSGSACGDQGFSVRVSY